MKMMSNFYQYAVMALMLCPAIGVGMEAADALKLADYKGNRLCAISYTFDDGMAEHHSFVFPLMESLGMKGTFWIIGKNVGTGQDDPQRYWMSWPELEEMAAAGHEMASHSWSHPNLTELSPAELRAEIERNDSIIEAHTGRRPVSFCYPYNAYNDSVKAAASKGRVGTRLYEKAVGQNVSKCSLDELNSWADKLMADRSWGVTMTHGIHYGYDYFDDPQVLVDHLTYVAHRSDRIWVDTFAAVGAYVAERDATRLSVVAESPSEIVVKPCLALEPTLFGRPLTMVLPDGLVPRSVTQDGRELPLYVGGGAECFDFDPHGGDIVIKL